jgi:hypothetical protein
MTDRTFLQRLLNTHPRPPAATPAVDRDALDCIHASGLWCTCEPRVGMDASIEMGEICECGNIIHDDVAEDSK